MHPRRPALAHDPLQALDGLVEAAGSAALAVVVLPFPIERDVDPVEAGLDHTLPVRHDRNAVVHQADARRRKGLPGLYQQPRSGLRHRASRIEQRVDIPFGPERDQRPAQRIGLRGTVVLRVILRIDAVPACEGARPAEDHLQFARPLGAVDLRQHRKRVRIVTRPQRLAPRVDGRGTDAFFTRGDGRRDVHRFCSPVGGLEPSARLDS